MPAPRADDTTADALRACIERYAGLEHLRVRRYGATLLVESGPADGPFKHLRFRRDTVHLWWLEIATHTGRWEPTPHRGTLEELFALVANTYPWTIAPVA